MGYVSRRYLREKWSSVKWDIEKVLKVDDASIGDEISKEDIERCYELQDNLQAILNELANVNS